VHLLMERAHRVRAFVVLDALRGADTSADWFAGKSEIRGDDWAIAFLDEIKQPAHHKARFTVAYRPAQRLRPVRS